MTVAESWTLTTGRRSEALTKLEKRTVLKCGGVHTEWHVDFPKSFHT